MSVSSRPARVVPPLVRPEPLVMAAPPALGDAPAGGIPLQTLLPVVGSLSSITMIVVLRANPLMVLLGAVILMVALVSAVGMALTQRAGARRARHRERERFAEYLEELRQQCRAGHDKARAAAVAVHPGPEQLGVMVRHVERVWERRPGDADFLDARVGAGVVRWQEVVVPAVSDPLVQRDPMMDNAARVVSDAYSVVAGMPVWVPLASAMSVSVVGAPGVAHGVVRALLAQVVTWHSPADVRVAAVIPPARYAEWEGIQVLPHCTGPGWDGPLRERWIAHDMAGLAALLESEFAARATSVLSGGRTGGIRGAHEVPLIVCVDASAGEVGECPLPAGVGSLAQLGVRVVTVVSDRVAERSDTSVRVVVDESLSASLVSGAQGVEAVLSPDLMSVEVFAAVAGGVAAHGGAVGDGAPTSGGRDGVHTALSTLGVTRVGDVSPALWGRRRAEDFLCAPMGWTPQGAVLSVNLRESAQGGMGPHGLCVGATGSGKSELLRTLVLNLAATHDPSELSMILVDYKGGAAFTPLSSLPHVAGVIDNLADDPFLIERAQASLEGEIVRRQQLLKQHGPFSDITAYRAARVAAGESSGIPQMPHVFVVIDEFSELLTAEPEFMTTLMKIGRIGRALGIHLLLASQRVDTGRLRGLDTYLSYRIGLRTFSEQESVMIVDSPDAYHLPQQPGHGYLKVDTTMYARFTAAYVSGPVPDEVESDSEDIAQDVLPWPVMALPFTNTLSHHGASRDLSGLIPSLVAPSPQSQPRLIDAMVASLSVVPATPPVWLPPLTARVLLTPTQTPVRSDSRCVAIGVEDRPATQEQGPWVLNLAQAGGHVAIIGSPQSGRTTTLRTIVAAIATTYAPTDIAVYGLDLTGSGLACLAGFPHVGAIATRTMRELQHRTVQELARLITRREQLMAQQHIDSLTDFRARHTRGELPGEKSADIVVVVDGYGAVRSDYEDLAAPLTDLLTRGSSVGVHVIMTVTRWNEIPMSVQPLIGTRVELRLNDPAESSIARKRAETMRSAPPGRALTDAATFAQVALPIPTDPGDTPLGDAVAAYARQVTSTWGEEQADPIRVLPSHITADQLPPITPSPTRIALGLHQDTMTTHVLDLATTDPHLIVVGDAGCGKTTLLRHVITHLVAHNTPESVVFALIDPRSTLAGVCSNDFIGAHATSTAAAQQLVASLTDELQGRINGERSRDLAIMVVVDDLDIVTATGHNPLTPLVPFLPAARDINLHILVARPVAGAARALYDPVLHTLKDNGASGIIMSGDRSEGPLWPGVYASAQPPGRATIIRRGDSAHVVHIATPTHHSPREQ